MRLSNLSFSIPPTPMYKFILINLHMCKSSIFTVVPSWGGARLSTIYCYDSFQPKGQAPLKGHQIKLRGHDVINGRGNKQDGFFFSLFFIDWVNINIVEFYIFEPQITKNEKFKGQIIQKLWDKADFCIFFCEYFATTALLRTCVYGNLQHPARTRRLFCF